MKICYWTPDSVGGAGKYESELAERMRRTHDVRVIARDKESLVRGNPLALFRYYDQGSADLVHATTSTLSLYGLPKPSTFVVTVHDMKTVHRTLSSTLKRGLIRLFRSLERADAVITPSAFTKREVVQTTDVDADRIRVVPMGVSHDRYRSIDSSDARRELDLDPNRQYVLVVASNDPHKRTDLVKTVASKLHAADERIILLKAGYGSRLTGANIHNVGYVSESKMPYLYNAADVLFHPSAYEGFGMPLLEAMACGTPVVASDAASIPEVVGPCGRLVDLETDDPASRFVDQLFAALDEQPSERLRERSREFSWDRTARETVRVYREFTETTAAPAAED